MCRCRWASALQSPFLIYNKTSCLDFQYFCQPLTLDLSVFQFLPFGFCVICLSGWLLLSLSLCSVKHGQRAAAEQPWWVRCKATEKHLINLPSLWLILQAAIPKSRPFVFFTLFSLNAFIILSTAQIIISVFATQTLNVNAGSFSWLPSVAAFWQMVPILI